MYFVYLTFDVILNLFKFIKIYDMIFFVLATINKFYYRNSVYLTSIT